VGCFFWVGFLRGDGLLFFATPKRRESLAGHLAHLGVDVGTAVLDKQLALLDANEVLSAFMIDGEPHWPRFQDTISNALKLARPRGPSSQVSAYGEMVGVLWEAGQTEAAIRLEECWNQFLHGTGMKLFCGYPIDVFGTEFHADHVHDVLRVHNEVFSAGPNCDVRDALYRAMDECLGPVADEMRLMAKERSLSSAAALPDGESAILWLRSNSPENAEKILACARGHYETSREQQGSGAPSQAADTASLSAAY
jgi:hypothetical protein